jgi:hypothetical protein
VITSVTSDFADTYKSLTKSCFAGTIGRAVFLQLFVCLIYGKRVNTSLLMGFIEFQAFFCFPAISRDVGPAALCFVQ